VEVGGLRAGLEVLEKRNLLPWQALQARIVQPIALSLYRLSYDRFTD
jgi:hypothetical protein